MWNNPPLHLALGLSAVLIGLLLALGAPATDAEITHLGALPALSAARLEDIAPGREVLVEGRVSPDAPPIYRDFVAYAREEYRRPLLDGTEHWIESERATSPFALRLPDGDVAIVNDDYDFARIADGVREAEPTATRGAVRSRGLRLGAPVFAVGTVVATPGGPGLHATQVYPGTRATFVAEAAGWSQAELRIGLGMLLLGLGELGLGGWQLRRFLREARADPAPAPQRRGRRV